MTGGSDGALSPLSGFWRLHQQMSKKEKPLSKWEGFCQPSLLNKGGSSKSSHFTIRSASWESSASLLINVPHWDPVFGNCFFFSPCIPLVCRFNVSAGPIWLHSTFPDRRGVFYLCNRQLHPDYKLRKQIETLGTRRVPTIQEEVSIRILRKLCLFYTLRSVIMWERKSVFVRTGSCSFIS